MIAVFAGFIFSDSATIRPIGFGLAFGVLLDAFIVRMLLIPAAMHLLGNGAWWIPQWLDRLIPNIDVEGTSLEERTVAPPHALHPARRASGALRTPPAQDISLPRNRPAAQGSSAPSGSP